MRVASAQLAHPLQMLFVWSSSLRSRFRDPPPEPLKVSIALAKLRAVITVCCPRSKEGGVLKRPLSRTDLKQHCLAGVPSAAGGRQGYLWMGSKLVLCFVDCTCFGSVVFCRFLIGLLLKRRASAGVAKPPCSPRPCLPVFFASTHVAAPCLQVGSPNRSRHWAAPITRIGLKDMKVLALLITPHSPRLVPSQSRRLTHVVHGLGGSNHPGFKVSQQGLGFNPEP